MTDDFILWNYTHCAACGDATCRSLTRIFFIQIPPYRILEYECNFSFGNLHERFSLFPIWSRYNVFFFCVHCSHSAIDFGENMHTHYICTAAYEKYLTSTSNKSLFLSTSKWCVQTCVFIDTHSHTENHTHL